MVWQLARGLAAHWRPKRPDARRGLRQSWRAYRRLRGPMGDVVILAGLLRLLAYWG